MLDETDLLTIRWLLARTLCEGRPQLNEEQSERVVKASQAVQAEIERGSHADDVQDA